MTLLRKEDRRPRRRIPTGAPRLVESSRARRDRAVAESWASLLDIVRRCSEGRLTLLSGRAATEQMGCPWHLLTGCVPDCRCGGTKLVTVRFLRDHYKLLPNAIATLAIASRTRRRR